MTKLNGFPRTYLAYFFRYDEKTGKLFWRVTKNSRAVAGSEAGTVDGKGYLHVCIDGQFLRVHRVIYFLLYGKVPKEVDHKNNNRRDNRKINLRKAGRKENSGNSLKQRNNTSGFRGVSRHGRDQHLWVAQIKLNGRQTYLGRFLTRKEAAAAYNSAAKKHFKKYAKLNRV